MRFCRLVLALLVLLGMVSADAAAPKKPFKSQQDVLKWISGYKARPEPQRLPDAVRAMSAFGVFRDLDQAGIYVGFMAGVLGANSAKAEALVAAMFPIPPEDQVAIIRAIAYSGIPEWKALLEKFVERMPARKVLIQHHLYGKAPTLQTLPLHESPAALDTLWGFYFATGSAEPVRRIVSVLGWSRDVNDVEKLTLGSMAKWTLATNAQKDKDLLDHLKNEMNRQAKDIQRELREVITAAETFETSKLRKDAVAAIEELRRKGPQSTRNATYWGQAGQTALALGCVVAGALGHAEIAVPCVVGGAVSSAALRLLPSQ
ncbi:MAG: hypothetical protein ACKVP7_17605 [Hyphomicrobiaceae bacterium]